METEASWPKIAFLPGLNTFGDDRVHVGPLALGETSHAWMRAMSARGFAVSVLPPVRGRGWDEDLEAILHDFDAKFPAADRIENVRGEPGALLLAHSAGGLIARALAHARPTQVAAILTVGSPHAGAPMATCAQEAAARNSPISRLARAIGYDPQSRLRAFSALAPASASAFLAKRPLPEGIAAAHALCRAEGRALSPPLLALAVWARAGGAQGASDGMVPCESQKYGECLGEYALDHYAQLGAFLQTRPSARTAAKAELERLADDASAFFRRSLARATKWEESRWP